MISLAVTTYNRCYNDIVQSFIAAIANSSIDEIIIVDDHSAMHVYADICTNLRAQKTKNGHKNIQLYRNDTNIGMAANKKKAVSLCKNDWVIIFDSDNQLTDEYINACISICKNNGTIYCPDRALPNFNYEHFTGNPILAANVTSILGYKQFDCLINTCNYLVPKEEFLSVWQPDPSIDAADSALFFYQWLKSGKQFVVVAGMSYLHQVHPGSGFMKNVEKNMADVKSIIQKIKQLS